MPSPSDTPTESQRWIRAVTLGAVLGVILAWVSRARGQGSLPQ
ncbi:MAG: hypothetical protein ABI635_07790 [Actinomycetota bacterium]